MAGYDFLAHSISTLVNVITAQFKTKYLIGLIYLTPFTCKYMYITDICLVYNPYRLYTLIAGYFLDCIPYKLLYIYNTS